MNGIFDRLNWSILDLPSKAEMFFLDSEGKLQWVSLSTVADETAMKLPQSRLQIKVQLLASWEHWQQAKEEPPKPLLIDNTDGQPISVKQFMQAVHDYALSLRWLLCKSCNLYGPEEVANTRFYFTRIMGLAESTHMYVVEDTDEDGHQLKSHLELVEILYRRQLASNAIL